MLMKDNELKDTNLGLEGESGSVQIKLFLNNREYDSQKQLEKEVNSFLVEHKDRIKVRDIKYSTIETNHSSPGWNNWTVMVIYEVI